MAKVKTQKKNEKGEIVMKNKILALILAMMLVLSMVACGAKAPAEEPAPAPEPAPEPEPSEEILLLREIRDLMKK